MNPSDMARALGGKGGRARALSLHAARRIAENFRYAEAMDALQPRPKVVRLRSFEGPLPGTCAFQAHER
jgi:hypothetical protein